MNAEAALRESYEEWRRLAEVEREAICSRDWQHLADCHADLQQLQAQIERETEQAKVEWATFPGAYCEGRAVIEGIVSELIALQIRNQTLLESQLAVTVDNREQLEQTRRNLRRIQTSYCQTPAPVWTSFS
jgi:hypothetical protein